MFFLQESKSYRKIGMKNIIDCSKRLWSRSHSGLVFAFPIIMGCICQIMEIMAQSYPLSQCYSGRVCFTAISNSLTESCRAVCFCPAAGEITSTLLTVTESGAVIACKEMVQLGNGRWVGKEWRHQDGWVAMVHTGFCPWPSFCSHIWTR